MLSYVVYGRKPFEGEVESRGTGGVKLEVDTDYDDADIPMLD